MAMIHTVKPRDNTNMALERVSHKISHWYLGMIMLPFFLMWKLVEGPLLETMVTCVLAVTLLTFFRGFLDLQLILNFVSEW